MFESILEELRENVEKSKIEYEKAKKKRDNLSKTMEELDNELTRLEEIIAPQKEKETKKDYQQLKEKLKRIIDKITSFVINGNIGCFIFNFIAKTWDNYIYQIVTLTIIGTCIYTIPEIILWCKERKNSKRKKYSKKALEKTQKEYDEALQKRLQAGLKYKDIREQEVELQQLYQLQKERLDEKIAEIEANYNYSSSKEPIDINLMDIYYKIKVDSSFYEESKEQQLKIFDEKLKEYIIGKILELHPRLQKESLEGFTTTAVASILIDVCKDTSRDQLNHLIHAILGFAGNIQNCGIIWYEEEETSLIENPQITMDEKGKWDKLITHKNTPHKLIFSLVYKKLINETLSDDKTYSRKRNKNSNHC